MVKLSRCPHSGYTHCWYCRAVLTYSIPTLTRLWEDSWRGRFLLLKSNKKRRNDWSSAMKLLQHRPLPSSPGPPVAPVPAPLPSCAARSISPPGQKSKPALKLPGCGVCHLPLAGGVAFPCPRGSGVLWEEQGGPGRSSGKCRVTYNR